MALVPFRNAWLWPVWAVNRKAYTEIGVRYIRALNKRRGTLLVDVFCVPEIFIAGHFSTCFIVCRLWDLF